MMCTFSDLFLFVQNVLQSHSSEGVSTAVLPPKVDIYLCTTYCLNYSFMLFFIFFLKSILCMHL